MPFIRDTDASIRENILEFLKVRFEDLAEGSGGYTETWNTVTRRPLRAVEMDAGSSLAIFDTNERAVPEIQYTLKTLEVAIEFYIVARIGSDEDQNSTELNRLLTDIQRAMRSDITCGGLCHNSVETRSEFDLDGPGERLVGGITFWNISYRHKENDPRKLLGET
jgi:hypothetical protein